MALPLQGSVKPSFYQGVLSNCAAPCYTFGKKVGADVEYGSDTVLVVGCAKPNREDAIFMAH
ncbi:MAG: hypothetical protein VB055_00055 [Oscillospiraceae bacterium]|nr:hypothetical protein [Oscillospiraceae bacterium]